MNIYKRYDILVVGELNIDLIMNGINRVPEFGKEQRASEMTLTTGSSSAIFAVNSAGLGSRVVFCGKTGDDSFGNYMIESLAAKSVNTEAIIKDKSCKTGATVIFNYGNDRMMVTHPGAMEHMEIGDIPVQLFESSRHLHISAVFFQPKLKKTLETLFETAKEHGLTTSMDTQWDPEEKWDIDLQKILPLLDFFLPNEHELMELTNCNHLEQALEQVAGFETTIVAKRGTKGVLMQYKGTKTTLPAYIVPNFVDAIGAGDSFNAGFIHSFLAGKTREECLQAGSLVAAVSTSAAGGTDAITNYREVFEKGKEFELSQL